MSARQIFARVVVGLVLIVGAMGEMTLCAGQEAAARERKAKAKRPGREDMEAAGQKIKAAVEAGEMTEAEGRAKWEAYLKKIGVDKGRRPRRGGRDVGEAEWRQLHEELAAQGMGRDKWRELFDKKKRGEALEPKEEAAIQKILELKKKMDRNGGGRERRPGDKVLDRWLGTWRSDVIIGPCAFVPEGAQYTEIKEVRWILNGRFQEVSIRSDDTETRETQRSDGGGQPYRKWVFSTAGYGHGYWTGSWDDQADTMTWKLDFGAIKGTMVDSFSDTYRYVTALDLKDAKGKVLLNYQAEHTRLLKK